MATDKNKPKGDLGVLEDDDEFEEFPAEEFNLADDDEGNNAWEDNWDDDNIEDDFSQQLKIHKIAKPMET